jgi:transcriptional regulator with PAS, ATPase and Fis domain
LIKGESGTGKELVARAIHNLSHRHQKPMITVNCGALPDTLLESELFGYKKGAFTGATKDKPGRFALAKGGTLFLDEIADISPALQVRLLRVLQEHTYEPLGGTESVTADVRVVAAVNRNLQKLVKNGKFREDLYYRINVLQIELPPLRERTEDIQLLIEHFIDRLNKTRDKFIEGISPEVLSILMTYDYPGNVRELENIIEHAFVLCQASTIGVECLPPQLSPKEKGAEVPARSVREFEKYFLIETLKKNKWSRVKTAAELGINKSTLWRKMKKLGIETPE